jgi:hypothetical protein
MNRLLRFFICVVVSLAFMGAEAYAQTGKISGQVTDAETGDPLPGVNVIIDGTTQGASTGPKGYYTILNVEAGVYTVRASFVGYARQVVEGVEVNVDLTTTLNIEMQEEAVGLDEVVVQSQEPVVKPDISANVSNMSSEDMENLPVASLEDMVGLQAGVQGMSIRGGSASSVGFRVDGSSTFDGRSNQAFTGISFTSIEQVQVQTGGFNAEYGNVRSGLVNVVTKDGPRNRYTADAIVRYSAPSRDYFGSPPNTTDSYFMRPYKDPEVKLVGTASEESPWDPYMRRQYPEWQGWDAYTEGQSDEYPDMTPELWEEVFDWYHRKDFSIDTPDYMIDGSFGGPVPVISEYLGDLRFMASYRQTQDAYIIPAFRDAHRDYLGRLRLTSDIASGMKLEFNGMLNEEYAHNATHNGRPSYFTGKRGSRNMVDAMYKHVDGREWELFADQAWSNQDIERYLGGLALTHTLNSQTFYRVRLNRMDTYYYAYKGPFRDSSTVRTIGSYPVTEAPEGFSWEFAERTPSDMPLGAYWSSAEDSSWAKRWDGSFQITSQVNRLNELKAGVDFIYTQHRRNNRQTTLGSPSRTHDWQRNTSQGAAFIQNKLEFEGLIANVGLRFDYFQPLGEWYDYGLFDPAFAAAADGTPLDELLSEEPIEGQATLSPRLGVSFPITTNSKLFFNYGHFREMLEPNNIFRIDRIGSVGSIGNPQHPMPKTVAYELGYEHNIFNQFLFRITGYYKDLSEQPRGVSFVSNDGNVSYRTTLPYNYEDVRGVELSLNRVVGNIRGWVNYTYMAHKYGNYGYGTYYESPIERRSYVQDYRNRVGTPVPQPYARMNLSFIVPQDFGPEFGGIHPLEDWRISFLGSWRAGNVVTWCGGGGACPGGISNNMSWKDEWDLDARVSKVFDTAAGQIMLFADIKNLPNIKRLNRNAFMTLQDDQRHYYRSLHIPEDTFEDIDPPPYRFIPGDDKFGEYRDYGTEFVPIEIISSFDAVQNPLERPLYYHAPGDIEEGTYYRFSDGGWEEASQERVDEVLEEKLYIDMPNLNSFWFLNPREFWFGVRYTF